MKIAAVTRTRIALDDEMWKDAEYEDLTVTVAGSICGSDLSVDITDKKVVRHNFLILSCTT